jgi:hypothetical protein
MNDIKARQISKRFMGNFQSLARQCTAIMNESSYHAWISRAAPTLGRPPLPDAAYRAATALVGLISGFSSFHNAGKTG